MLRYSSRFWLYTPISLFLLLAVAAMAHWWTVADTFEKRLAALKGQQAIPGVILDWTTVTVGGFPFRVDADFTHLSIKGAGAHGPFAWTTEKFALHALTYGRIQDVYEAAGRQQVTWTDGDGKPQAAEFLPASMRGSSIVDAHGLRRFDLDIIGLGAKDFTAARLQFHMRRDPDGSDLDLMFKADALKTQGHPRNLQVYALLSHGGALGRLLRGEKSWPEATADWRKQGGRAKLSQVLAPGVVPDTLLAPLY